MKIREFIKNNILLIDGAMGTYYSDLVKKDSLSELANIDNPQIIEKIHLEYIEAGAKLIRTNTFSANKYVLNFSEDKIKEILQSGYKIAKKSALDKDVYVACSIGPIPETNEKSYDEILEEYYFIIDCLLEVGADIFLFETFPYTEYIKDLVKYITKKNKEAEILAQFSVNAHGYTKKGISMERILEEVKEIKELSAYGFNCTIGAGHMYNLLQKINVTDYTLMAVPNAGYPEKIYNRTVYIDNASYFSETMYQICRLGANIVGGCCGTTPKHIKYMAKAISKLNKVEIIVKQNKDNGLQKKGRKVNKFYDKLNNNKFVTAVELDPPFNYDISKLMEAANILKVEGADIITIADSPLAKVRLDSLMMAAKIQREVGIEVMPHLCCRDKNIIAIKSGLMASYVEGIRNYLFVTGDPLHDEIRGKVSGVFNMNSIKLMEFVKTLNDEIDNKDYYRYGGALNPKLPNTKRVIERVLKKKEAGASYLLTQPVYTLEDIEKLNIIREETKIKIIGGIMPFVSYRNVWFIHNEFAGMNVPETIINRFKPDMTKTEGEEVGVEIAVEVAKQMKPYVDGFYFMTPFNRASMIAKIMKYVK